MTYQYIDEDVVSCSGRDIRRVVIQNTNNYYFALDDILDCLPFERIALKRRLKKSIEMNYSTEIFAHVLYIMYEDVLRVLKLAQEYQYLRETTRIEGRRLFDFITFFGNSNNISQNSEQYEDPNPKDKEEEDSGESEFLELLIEDELLDDQLLVDEERNRVSNKSPPCAIESSSSSEEEEEEEEEQNELPDRDNQKFQEWAQNRYKLSPEQQREMRNDCYQFIHAARKVLKSLPKKNYSTIANVSAGMMNAWNTIEAMPPWQGNQPVVFNSRNTVSFGDPVSITRVAQKMKMNLSANQRIEVGKIASRLYRKHYGRFPYMLPGYMGPGGNIEPKNHYTEGDIWLIKKAIIQYKNKEK